MSAIHLTLASRGLAGHRRAGRLIAAVACLSLLALPAAPAAAAPNVSRVAGADRFATAVALSQLRWDEPPAGATVYVASGTSFADALMAGPVVASEEAAVLLPVARDVVPAVVAAEIERLDPVQIRIVGGTGVVSTAVERQLGPAADVFALHRYAASMPDTWRPPVVLPYGPAEHQLGTSLGGDGEGIQWGPGYGTPAPDGTWWILDAAKTRFAHYDADGRYLGQVPIPTRFLVNGQYVQWQYPQSLADGTIVTYRYLGTDRIALLLLQDGAFREVVVDRAVTLKVTDGQLLYGFGDEGQLLAVDPADGTVAEVSAFRTAAGVRYRLAREGSALRFVLPDRGVDQTWPLVAAETSGAAAGAVSLAATPDGRFHVFVDGMAVADESTGLSGYGVVESDGTLHDTEPTRTPWSSSDDGSGSRLVAAPGGSTVWFVAIDTDAMRLYASR